MSLEWWANFWKSNEETKSNANIKPNLVTTLSAKELSEEEKQLLLQQDLLKSRILCVGKWNMVVLDIWWDKNLDNLKNEIYKLVEQTFQTIGWWTWLEVKTDKYNEYFNQLIVTRLWEENKIKLLSWYRYLQWLKNEKKATPMIDMFDIKDNSILSDNNLLNNNLKVLELWTAWSVWALDKLEAMFSFVGTWNGLTELTSKYADEDMFIGKMTIPANYNKRAIVFAIKYLGKVACKNDCGVLPKKSFDQSNILNQDEIKEVENDISQLSLNYDEDKKQIKEILKKEEYWETSDLPAMFPLYLDRFKKWEFYYIGTVQNGNVLESWIVVPVKALKDSVRENFKTSSDHVKWKTLWEYIWWWDK